MLEIPTPIVATALAHGDRRAAPGRGAPPRTGSRSSTSPPSTRPSAGSRATCSRWPAAATPAPRSTSTRRSRWVEAKTGIALAPAQREALALAAQQQGAGHHRRPRRRQDHARQRDRARSSPPRSCASPCAPRPAAPPSAWPRRPAARRRRSTACSSSTRPAAAFRHDADNPLDGDVFIIDETQHARPAARRTSWCAPCRATPRSCSSATSTSSPRSGRAACCATSSTPARCPVCRLTEVFRQAAASAHRHQRPPGQPRACAERARPGRGVAASDFYFVEAEDDPARARRAARASWSASASPRRFGLHAARRHPGAHADAARRARRAQPERRCCRHALNPHGPAIERFGWTFRVGDKVMQIENDYDKDVFNGDIGRIAPIDDGERAARRALRRPRRRPTTSTSSTSCSLAYAMHDPQGQGSEYPAVVMPIHTQHYMMLQRNLLYTGDHARPQAGGAGGAPKALAIAVAASTPAPATPRSRTPARRRRPLPRRPLAAACRGDVGSWRGAGVGVAGDRAQPRTIRSGAELAAAPSRRASRLSGSGRPYAAAVSSLRRLERRLSLTASPAAARPGAAWRRR